MSISKLISEQIRKVLSEDVYQQMTGKVDDHEVEMSITDLRSIAHRAAALADHLEKGGHQELEGWIQAKITKAADYIGAVYDNYMFSPDHECNTCGGGLNEEKSTCCGKCGHYHVKGTSCPKPYLTGKRHCRNRPR
jgi:hypothetical protein